jgi:hypothetical protein
MMGELHSCLLATLIVIPVEGYIDSALAFT